MKDEEGDLKDKHSEFTRNAASSDVIGRLLTGVCDSKSTPRWWQSSDWVSALGSAYQCLLLYEQKKINITIEHFCCLHS